ncbi:MAG: ISKra4 family transposase [Thermoanaerobaculales bacterium]|nr:ISKra4 family transposase [Thermoanaerobaculales bacterium]
MGNPMGAGCLAYAVVDPFEEFSQVATAVFQQWLENLRPAIEAEAKPDLRQLSELFSKTRGELLGGCLKAAVEEIYRPILQETKHSCEYCGKVLSRKRMASKRCSTMQGEFELERPYFYCETCKGWAGHPLDIALGLAREHHQYDVQEKMIRLTADLPYELSSKHFERLSGVGLGSHFAHTMLNEVVKYARFSDVIPQTEDIETRINEASHPGKSPPVLVIAIDGAHTPIRPPGGRKDKRGKGEWKETKGVRIYLATSDDRIVHILSWHRNGDKKAFAWDLKRIAAGMPKTDLQVAALADGAPWIWKLVKKYFPAARQVLDYFHCAEHVHKVANEQYADPSAAVEWAEATLVRLSLGRTGEVIGGLRRMKSRNADAREEIRKLIGYIDANRKRLAYDDCKAQGIPKGSGGIESANKYIHHARLKRSGAWWLKPNANGMLLIRCAVYNGTFNRVFDCHVAFQQELLNI